MRIIKRTGKQQPLTEEDKRVQQESLASLERGGLPLNALARLTDQATRQGTPQHIFTSDLSVNELLLVRQGGYEALGQVMGSSIYHIGWQWTPAWSGTSMELTVLTQAFHHARSLAIGRLQQEAAALRATGVVGVRLVQKQYEWGASLLEFAAIGTAIRELDKAGPDPGKAPFVSDLSGEEYWTLRQAGFRPVGYALGNCTFYQAATWRTQYAQNSGVWGTGWVNQELTDFTQACYAARSLAMERMESDARAAGATGVVGADVDMNVETREVDIGNNQHRTDLVLHFNANGTAIAPAEGRWPLFSVENAVPLTG